MLSSPARRFWWSKNRRILDAPPLFRLLSRRWRPVVRQKINATRPALRYGQRGPSSWDKAHSHGWNPWLWIK